ncbi:DNA breaking-rejoining enzyme [Laetiporus sulphureus 93-53]|uniref:DNA breaking-rejoining enzyme n=1 Tax=Laetiporus sulphureus 93-53 TaxID=1314785 RepID=A0A165HNU5_9APHY|nr:DNA breaking-rejoining enzyme [Laetiporus sulphureus 93-53]KZT11986.1 DNA breaking-rejoining enzyme [Laetiporus sulphureus 93-53]
MPKSTSSPASARADATTQGEGTCAVSATQADSSLPRNLALRTKKTARKPKPGLSVSSSALRPHVPASDRLALWRTPHGIQYRQNITASLPLDSTTALFRVLFSGLEEETRSNYGTALVRFAQFCDLHHIPESSRMPAPEFLLAAFIAQWHGRITRTTVDNWLSGLHFWHSIHSAPWHGGELVRIACKAISKAVPATPTRPKRPPVPLDHLHALRSGLDLTDAFDAAVYACACVAFWSVCRLGELTVPSAELINPRYHILRARVPQFRTLACGVEYTTLKIPWSKSTCQDGTVIIVSHLDDPTSPVPALRHHLAANATVPTHAPFFAYETASGGWAPLTRTWFLERCNKVWTSAGLQSVTGHSFRMGDATELLLRGIPLDVVAVQGRWK